MVLIGCSQELDYIGPCFETPASEGQREQTTEMGEDG